MKTTGFMFTNVTKFIVSQVQKRIREFVPVGIVIVFKKRSDGSHVSLYHDMERKKTDWILGKISVTDIK